jgi:hypothetical protein
MLALMPMLVASLTNRMEQAPHTHVLGWTIPDKWTSLRSDPILRLRMFAWRPIVKHGKQTGTRTYVRVPVVTTRDPRSRGPYEDHGSAKCTEIPTL